LIPKSENCGHQVVCKRLDQSEAELETLGTAIKGFGP
jgi:hypothetical protein